MLLGSGTDAFHPLLSLAIMGRIQVTPDGVLNVLDDANHNLYLIVGAQFEEPFCENASWYHAFTFAEKNETL
jgi:hypothetical protein